ncbi:hypothetical protein F5I97DRAFT_1855763 [Phlebopus sp. FC_14]|nr:hypothetical protein F5I97DRAFT_1855763 [Phlebopus sp. FC_14]
MQPGTERTHEQDHPDISCALMYITNHGFGQVTSPRDFATPSNVAAGHEFLPETGSFPTRLPPEIVYEIMKFLDPSNLVTAALLSKATRAIAERVLYGDPEPKSVKVIRCLQTLVMRPDLASITRRLTIYDLTRTFEMCGSYLSLLSRALHSVSSLTDLTLLLDGPYAKYFRGCSFRLRSLSTTLVWDDDLVLWLEEQSELTNAMFGGHFVKGTVLPQNALRKLSHVSAVPLILSATVPGRPVRGVEICLLHPELMKADILWTTTRILSFSTGPLSSMQIIADIEDAADALTALNVISQNVPKLDSFALYAGHGSVTRDFLDKLSGFVSGFEFLRSIMLMSRDPRDVLSDASLLEGLAPAWHSCCPTLECVSFAGSIWVRNMRYGWVTLSDLERLLRERVDTLAERERELAAGNLLNGINEDEAEHEDREQQMERQMQSQIVAIRAGMIQYGAGL